MKPSSPPCLADRMAAIEPFHVMDVLARAHDLEAAGRSVIHMEIGEPDFPTPEPIIAAGHRALAEGRTRYTAAAGISELRQLIANQYAGRFGVAIGAERVIVTPGASGALQLAISVLVNRGEQILMTDPAYPCNRNFLRLVEGEPICIPVDADSGYQLTAELVERNWGAKTVGVLLASPSNPTGTLVSRESLAEIVAFVENRGGLVIVDEIYQGLIYAGEAATALTVSDRLFVINSFSKYFGMTGWRLGWMVAPQGYIRALEKLAQNLFLSPSSLAQYSALAAFSPEVTATCEERRQRFKARRDYLVPCLRDLGFRIPVEPDGAFYVYADCSRFTNDSFGFAIRLLEDVGVAIAPGADFGSNRAECHVRFAYTTSMDKLKEGVTRLRRALA